MLQFHLVTSSNWNSLLSCNSINTPSTLTMGFSLWLALVGAMQGKMAVLGSQALRLQRFNLYDGRTEFSSAAPAALQLLRVQTKSPTKPTALWRERNFGVAGQTV